MTFLKSWTALTILGLLLTFGCAPKEEMSETPATEEVEPAPAPEPEPMKKEAVAHLQGREGSGITGTVTFTEMEGGVHIVADVSGVEGAPAERGFHIHETGDCSAPDFTSAGGHFNPAGVPHGGPSDAEHHAGDLGNIEIGEDGTGHLEYHSDGITLSEGPNSVVGLAVILHEKTDDLESQPTGAAGGRVACGVIEMAGEGGHGDEGDMGMSSGDEPDETVGDEQGV